MNQLKIKKKNKAVLRWGLALGHSLRRLGEPLMSFMREFEDPEAIVPKVPFSPDIPSQPSQKSIRGPPFTTWPLTPCFHF